VRVCSALSNGLCDAENVFIERRLVPVLACCAACTSVLPCTIAILEPAPNGIRFWSRRDHRARREAGGTQDLAARNDGGFSFEKILPMPSIFDRRAASLAVKCEAFRQRMAVPNLRAGAMRAALSLWLFFRPRGAVGRFPKYEPRRRRHRYLCPSHRARVNSECAWLSKLAPTFGCDGRPDVKDIDSLDGCGEFALHPFAHGPGGFGALRLCYRQGNHRTENRRGPAWDDTRPAT
jgi:hypothetical protein